MNKYYMGVDIGSISTKGVIIDEDNNIVAKDYLWTEGNPINAVKKLVESLYLQVDNVNVVGVGTTGSARYLIGKILDACVVKNEITAHAVGTLTFYEPSSNMFATLGHGILDVDTSELIRIENGELVTTNILSIEKGEKGVTLC